MDIQKTCCFTGHRPKTLPFLEQEEHPKYKELEKLWNRELQTLIEEKGVRHFISGMAIGFDLFAAEKILNLKKTYPDITLEAAVPHTDQAERWNRRQKEKYAKILKQCDQVTQIQDAYTPDCFGKRNQYMVDHSAYVLAVWNGKLSGTGKTVKRARDKKRKLILFDPNTWDIIWE